MQFNWTQIQYHGAKQTIDILRNNAQHCNWYIVECNEYQEFSLLLILANHMNIANANQFYRICKWFKQMKSVWHGFDCHKILIDIPFVDYIGPTALFKMIRNLNGSHISGWFFFLLLRGSYTTRVNSIWFNGFCFFRFVTFWKMVRCIFRNLIPLLFDKMCIGLCISVLHQMQVELSYRGICQ